MNKAIGMLAGAALLLWMAPANAATFFFTNDHCTGTCGGAIPYASITLTDTVQGVDILLTPLNGNQFNTAGGGLNTFNFNVQQTITSADILNLTAGYEFVANVGNQDGFGTFKYAITDDGSLGDHNANPISFTIVGVDFIDFRRSTVNGESVFFTIDIFGTNAKTGLVGSTNLVVEEQCTNGSCDMQNPIPGAVWLFGTVLAGGAGFGRWRKKRKQVA